MLRVREQMGWPEHAHCRCRLCRLAPRQKQYRDDCGSISRRHEKAHQRSEPSCSALELVGQLHALPLQALPVKGPQQCRHLLGAVPVDVGAAAAPQPWLLLVLLVLGLLLWHMLLLLQLLLLLLQVSWQRQRAYRRRRSCVMVCRAQRLASQRWEAWQGRMLLGGRWQLPWWQRRCKLLVL